MADFKSIGDDDLARRGRAFARRGQFALANEFLTEFCARMMRQEKPIPPAVLAAYGLADGISSDLTEGIQIYLSLARLHAQSGSRKRAIDAIDRGLSFSSKHAELLALQKQLGQRQPPMLPFLSRDHPVNVKLGRLAHKLRSGAREKSKTTSVLA